MLATHEAKKLIIKINLQKQTKSMVRNNAGHGVIERISSTVRSNQRF